jgi:hypothetical protein
MILNRLENILNQAPDYNNRKGISINVNFGDHLCCCFVDNYNRLGYPLIIFNSIFWLGKNDFIRETGKAER